MALSEPIGWETASVGSVQTLWFALSNAVFEKIGMWLDPKELSRVLLPSNKVYGGKIESSFCPLEAGHLFHKYISISLSRLFIHAYICSFDRLQSLLCVFAAWQKMSFVTLFI